MPWITGGGQEPLLRASGDTAGAVSFTIDGTDIAGNALEQVTSATDGSSVTYDDESPTLSAVSISSDNAAATWAKWY